MKKWFSKIYWTKNGRRFYAQQQTYREQADYQVDVDIERTDLEEFLEDAKTFIQEMKRIADPNKSD